LRCVEAANRRPDREAAGAPAGAGAVHPAEAPAARPAPPTPAPAAGVAAPPEAMAEAVAPGPVRQVIARRMVESWTTIPHAWTMVEADVTSLVALREQVREAFQQREGFELTYLPFAIKAVVDALQEHPDLNASWGPEGRIVRYRHVNISVAVGLDEALMVPVIREAERLSVTGIARALHDLVRRAKQGRLTADDTGGGTFTVNNTGALGSVLSAPIINPPQGAILTTEAIQRRLVVLKDDQLAIRSIMNLCLSFDHRIVDGVQALRFLNAVKRRLEAFGPGVPLA
ncbi:MAG: 2-oxo acid dehydrogenase subunit E2, partial [Bacillota bacterium]